MPRVGESVEKPDLEPPFRSTQPAHTAGLSHHRLPAGCVCPWKPTGIRWPTGLNRYVQKNAARN